MCSVCAQYILCQWALQHAVHLELSKILSSYSDISDERFGSLKAFGVHGKVYADISQMFWTKILDVILVGIVR